MTDPIYDIFITGRLKDGVDVATAAANLARLFKISDDKAAALVDGKPHCLKKGAEREVARRYLAALQRAGFETAGNKREAAAPTASESDGGFSLAPPGAPVLREDERATIIPVEVDTSAYSLASPFEEPPEERAAPELEAPDFGLAPAGSLLEELPRYDQPLNPDTSALSLAQPGEDLAPASRKPPPPPPSTDHIHLADE